MKPSEHIVKFVLPVVLVVLALLIGLILVKTTKKPDKKKPQRTAYVVEVVPLKAGSQRVKLQATGTVVPAQEITLKARVSGEIVEISPDFIEGGQRSLDVLSADRVGLRGSGL